MSGPWRWQSPAMAKSPDRRAIAVMDCVSPSAGTGNSAAETISPGPSVVLIAPTKKLSAATRRSPRAEARTGVASSATAQAGSSAAGSAMASEPPPLLWMAGWAISGAACASIGAWAATSGSRASSACRVSAPMRGVRPVMDTPRNSATRVMSTSRLGAERRKPRVASRLCPPASMVPRSSISGHSSMRLVGRA